jgi:hypothetical protein
MGALGGGEEPGGCVAGKHTHHFTEGLGVDELAVVGDGEGAVGRVHDEGLTVDLLAGGAGAVARVTDPQVAPQLPHTVVVEDVVDHAHALVHVEGLGADALARHYARTLLAPVLQRDQTWRQRERAVFKLASATFCVIVTFFPSSP